MIGYLLFLGVCGALCVGGSVLLVLAVDYIQTVVRTQYTDAETGITFRRCWMDFSEERTAREIEHEYWLCGHAVRAAGPDAKGRFQVWYSVGNRWRGPPR